MFGDESNVLILYQSDFLTSQLERNSDALMDMDVSLDAILDVSPYNREEDIKAELRKISERKGGKTGSGTKIVLFNLKR